MVEPRTMLFQGGMRKLTPGTRLQEEAYVGNVEPISRLLWLVARRVSIG